MADAGGRSLTSDGPLRFGGPEGPGPPLMGFVCAGSGQKHQVFGHQLSRFSRLPLLCAALVATGCAVGNTHTFNYRPQETTGLGRGTTVLVFAVKD